MPPFSAPPLVLLWSHRASEIGPGSVTYHASYGSNDGEAAGDEGHDIGNLLAMPSEEYATVATALQVPRSSTDVVVVEDATAPRPYSRSRLRRWRR